MNKSKEIRFFKTFIKFFIILFILLVVLPLIIDELAGSVNNDLMLKNNSILVYKNILKGKTFLMDLQYTLKKLILFM
ncbi:MAG: hypothetical protein ACM3TR_15560 [Caulobacteraceae bacterium]